MNKIKYDVIYSIGTNCACAEYLRKYNLRKYAGPLDWITSANINAPFETICTHFQSFLNFTYIVPLEEDSPKACNQICKHVQNGYIFFHDFIAGQNIRLQIPSILAKYTRRVTRFENDLKKGKKVLLVWYAETGSQLPFSKILYYVNSIRQLHTADIHFLFITYTEKGETFSCQIPLEGVSVYQLPEKSLANRKEGYLLWDLKQLDPIFNNLSLKISYWQNLKTKIKALFFRILSVGIVNKKKRHAFVESHVKNDGC